jgi:adenosylmethionine---8-amino-7-oxononanoate aminotransferase
MMSLVERDLKVIWHPYTQAKLTAPPIPIVRGEGVYLFDEAENKYIDAISSWWVNIHGHAHPYIADKVAAQLNKLEQVIFAGFTHEPAVQLAEKLVSILPVNQSKVFYSDNGSTAVEVAVKMAIQYWNNKGVNKRKIIALEHAYHGDTFGAMSVSAKSSFTKPFDELLFEVVHIPFPGKGMEDVALKELSKQIQTGGIAAFIFEPLVLGAGGMLMYEADVLDSLLAICKQNKVLTIADEVMTGFGRTGKYFASLYLQHQPDIICLSKGITGGTMPLSVTTATNEIYDAFISDDRSKTFFHGHSYTANPIACAAALASFDLLITDECLQSIKRITEQHKQFIQANQSISLLKNLRSTGTILAMDVVSNVDTSYFNPIRDKLYNYFLNKGLLLRPLGNTIYVMPPYCITNDELEQIYQAIIGLGEVLNA